MAAKQESSGLLSRVVKFVKNSGTGWGALEQREADGEALVSKQMLKEMIERKRRNDFVRKREFDMLRKMRRSDLMAGQDFSTRPSFFQTSIVSRIDDRAVTLKKIDDIEAQMSMQWWKTHHESPVRPAPTGQAPLGASAVEGGSSVGGQVLRVSNEPTEPVDLASLLEFEFSAANGELPDERSSYDRKLQDVLGAPTVAGELPADVGGSTSGLAVSSGSIDFASFGSSGALPDPTPSQTRNTGTTRNIETPGATDLGGEAIVVGEEFTHDPELEEAAIRFANGDHAGAEAGLLEVLAPGGSRIDHDETWLTLFDLYRATGEHERFEVAALDFARRFSRSAPQWVSFPEAVGRMNQTVPKAVAPGAALADWSCPSSMGLQTVAAMNAALARSPRPWRLSWAKLNSIDRAAAEALKRAFTQWSSEPFLLHFLAPEKLEKVLADATPSGDPTVDPVWWQLRMELLRLINRPDEFELVALDYCVTYEVSPPSWEKTACKYKPLQADGSPVTIPTIIGEPAYRDSVFASGFVELGRPGTICTVELAGEILGDAADALAMLDVRLGEAESIEISCARLIRIDFSAAGMLLNWVALRTSEGRQVQFTEVHRLVAAFFNVIAISEHARVVVRNH